MFCIILKDFSVIIFSGVLLVFKYYMALHCLRFHRKVCQMFVKCPGNELPGPFLLFYTCISYSEE